MRSFGRVGPFGRFLFLLCALLCAVPPCAFAESLSSWSNTGLTGLWEYPTAEMPADGHGRFGYTHASPYAFYFLDLAWLPWLEINARLSTFDTIRLNTRRDAEGNPAGRYYMDKAIDLKAMLYRSSAWYLPSVALGINDATGTELMKAWYGVATWHFGDVGVTMGWGSDRMNGAFAGLTWTVADWLTVKAEYSPLDYTQDTASSRKVMTEEPSSKYNVGLVLRAPWGTEGAFSWQRGDEFVFSISQRFNLNGPFLFSDKPRHRSIERPGEFRAPQWGDIAPDELLDHIVKGLDKYVRVRDVDVQLGDRTVTVAYENYGHASHAEAMVRVLVVLSAVLPQTDSVTLVPRISGVPVVRAEFPGSLLFDIRTRSLRRDALQPAVFLWADETARENGKVSRPGPDNESDSGSDLDSASETESTESEEPENSPEDFNSEKLKETEFLFSAWGRPHSGYVHSALANKGRHELKGMLVYEPRLDQTLESSYEHRWSLDLVYQGRYSDGFGAFADIRFPLYNNVDIWWEPDMNSHSRLQRAGVNYITNWQDGEGGPGLWLMGEAGWLDEEWFGVNFWTRYYLDEGRWWIGARLSAQRDRDPESFAGLADGQIEYYNGRYINGYRETGGDPWRLMAWLQAGYNFPELDLDVQADWGRFVDTDTGFKIAAVRHWDDTSLGFWFIRTDRLYSDKDYTRVGAHLELPAEKWFGSWLGQASGHVWEQDTLLLSSWRIDSGREGGHVRTPERTLGQLRPVVLRQNVDRLLQEYCSFEEGKDIEYEAQSLLDLVFPAMKK